MVPKVGRNESCQCGSGKKYKKCCGAPTRTVPSNYTGAVQEKARPLVGTWGLPGIEINMVLTRRSSTNPDYPGNFATTGGAPGKYKVSFILSRPEHAPLRENHVTFSDQDIVGDSHLRISETDDTRVDILWDLPEGRITFYCYPNQKGYLSRMEMLDIEALNFVDAGLQAYNKISPFLSRLSLALDIPFHVHKLTTKEESTQNYITSFKLPFLERAGIPQSEYLPEKESSKFASLYREALNSNSPNYQYLCYYKIIEGIRRIRDHRTALENQDALARGEKPPVRKREFIPATGSEQAAWLSSLYQIQSWSEMAIAQAFPPEASGRKLNDVIKTSGVLDTVRNRIAHAVMRDESQETISIDDGLHMSEVAKWLPLCKCIARHLLKAEYPKLFDT